MCVCSADGVGDVQQSGLRGSHLSQYERVGLGVEESNVPGLQLLTQVSDAKHTRGTYESATFQYRRAPLRTLCCRENKSRPVSSTTYLPKKVKETGKVWPLTSLVQSGSAEDANTRPMTSVVQSVLSFFFAEIEL